MIFSIPVVIITILTINSAKGLNDNNNPIININTTEPKIVKEGSLDNLKNTNISDVVNEGEVNNNASDENKGYSESSSIQKRMKLKTKGAKKNRGHQIEDIFGKVELTSKGQSDTKKKALQMYKNYNLNLKKNHRKIYSPKNTELISSIKSGTYQGLISNPWLLEEKFGSTRMELNELAPGVSRSDHCLNHMDNYFRMMGTRQGLARQSPAGRKRKKNRLKLNRNSENSDVAMYLFKNPKIIKKLERERASSLADDPQSNIPLKQMKYIQSYLTSTVKTIDEKSTASSTDGEWNSDLCDFLNLMLNAAKGNSSSYLSQRNLTQGIARLEPIFHSISSSEGYNVAKDVSTTEHIGRSKTGPRNSRLKYDFPKTILCKGKNKLADPLTTRSETIDASNLRPNDNIDRMLESHKSPLNSRFVGIVGKPIFLLKSLEGFSPGVKLDSESQNADRIPCRPVKDNWSRAEACISCPFCHNKLELLISSSKGLRLSSSRKKLVLAKNKINKVLTS